MSWAVPFVTGHKYRLHWGQNLDWTQMKVELSSRWEPTDLDLHIMMNFTDTRASINVTDTKKNKVANETLIKKAAADLVAGDFVVYNDTKVREFHFVINGKDMANRSELLLQGFRCVVDCDQKDINEKKISGEIKYWSDTTTWPSGKLPVEGEDVEIAPGENVVLDISTPRLFKLTINGRLTFLNDAKEPKNLTLNTNLLYVRAGELIIGNQTHP